MSSICNIHNDVATVANMYSAQNSSRSDLQSHGILLGKHASTWIWTGSERSALILGPTRSGKTTSIIIPNVLCAPGAVITTSTKRDVMDATTTARTRAGNCLLFDPMGTVDAPRDVQRIGWSPLRGAHTWDGAIEISSSMVNAAQQRSRSDANSRDHWSERSSALLACLLHAARHADCEMDNVLAWTDRHRGEAALEILNSQVGPSHPATALLEGILATDSRELSAIWSNTSGVLGAYRSLGALAATREESLDPKIFVESPNTLYICAPGRQQALLAPLVVGLLSEIQHAGYDRGRSEQPVLFALDELANIAPLPDLPQLVSEGAGQGVITIGCLQDLSQARMRWGREADGLLSLFSTTLVLPGIADMTTLKTIQALGGRKELLQHGMSISRDQRGRRSRSQSITEQLHPRLEIDEISQGRTGQGLMIDASKRLGWIELSPAHRDEPWRTLTIERTDRSLDRSR